jgi:hypothetical protein
MATQYKFGNDTLHFDSDADAIKYAEDNNINEFTPLTDTPVSPVAPKSDATVNQQAPTDNQGYLERSYNYAAGQPDQDPTTLGRVWKGSASTIVDHPVSLLAAALAPEASIGSGIEAGLTRLSPWLARGIAGFVEGSALSAGDQIASPILRRGTTEEVHDNPNVQLFPTLAAGVTGGVIRPLMGIVGDQVKNFKVNKAARDEYASDPLDATFKSPALSKSEAEEAAYRAKFDPNDLYGEYSAAKGYGESVGDAEWHKGLLQKAKTDIAQRSAIPVSPSSISNAEARQHLNGIVSKIEDEFAARRLPVEVQPAPYHLDVSKEIPSVLTNGFIGNAIAGIPGLITGAALGNNTGRRLISDAATRAVVGASKVSVPLVRGLATAAGPLVGGTITKRQDPLAPEDTSFFRY